MKNNNLKIIKRILLGVIAVPLLILLAIFTINKILMKKEAHLLEHPLGQMVEVDGHNMSYALIRCLR